MTFPANPAERSPKGDHNRRLAPGLSPENLAAQAGIRTEQLRAYELTDIDGTFDLAVAERVGTTLDRLEAVRVPIVDNGGAPEEGDGLKG